MENCDGNNECISPRPNESVDYVRHLIRRDQERQSAIATLQDAINDGLNSGTPELFDPIEFNATMRKKHGA